MTIIVTDTAQTYRALARGRRDSAEESFKRSDTDGCVTQYVSTLTARQYEAAASIAEAGGTNFTVLHTLDGRKLNARVINGKFGLCWKIDDDDFDLRFAPYKPARKQTLAKRGLQEVEEFVEAQYVAVRIASPPGARGFSGLSSCYITYDDIRTWGHDTDD